MPKSPEFTYRKTEKGWLVNTPASLAASGKRQRSYFGTRDEAKEYSANLRDQFLSHGAKAATIRPSLAEDATRAMEILESFGVTLTQAARFYASHHDKRTKAPTLATAWEQGLDHRKHHRARTLTDLKAWQKSLPKWFLETNCYDVTATDIRKALDEVTSGPTYWRTGLRNISAILGDVVKSGLIEKNPASSVHVARQKEAENDEVSLYTPDELRAVFDACIDYPKPESDRLCAACTVPFAIMAFAGIRPDEVSRLRWDDISLELNNIRIGARVAKKATRRNVRINPTLAAWLCTVSVEKREGKVIPPRWRYKAAKVRIKAGIDGREKQDALRHSFGTYLLATENNLDLLKSDMGHEHVRVFFTHYHKAVTKADALPYWKIFPRSNNE